MSQPPYEPYPGGATEPYPSGDGGWDDRGYGTPTPTPVGPPPATVSRAVLLMFVRVGVGLLGIVVALATIGSLRTQIRDRANVKPADVDTIVTVSIVSAVVLGLIFAALYVLLAFKVRGGRRWARIVTIVLATLGVLSLLSSLTQGGTAAAKSLAIVAGLIDLAILVLLLLRPSSQYFARR